MRRAELIYHDKLIEADGSIIEMKIWRLPTPVMGSTHHLKYRLFYGKNGQRIVGYDNERGKGDHRHLRDVEEHYPFTTVEQMVADFLNDVEQQRGNFHDQVRDSSSQ